MIKVGIVGYGNLGRGVTLAVNKASDMECVGIFTRREPALVKPAVDYPVYKMEELEKFKGKIDVLKDIEVGIDFMQSPRSADVSLTCLFESK